MDEIPAIFVAGSAVVTLLLVAFIAGIVIFTRRNDAPPRS
ncbi:hypothetical protein OKW40_000852 [Paraburkholderia sp. RAU6.4a]|nr:hypothetical protein [Paraburkholderia sp. HC6.4b]MBB5455894.1 hypothetical protein [Paraburkholderia sp. Kb1A]